MTPSPNSFRLSFSLEPRLLGVLQIALGVELLDDGGVPVAGLHALELLGGGEEVIGPREGFRLQVHRLGDLEPVQAGPLAVQLDLAQDGLLLGFF